MPSKTRFGLVCLVAFAGMAGLATATGLASAAFHSDRAPPPKAFDLDGERFHWAVAHGVVGSVGLSRRTAVFDDGTEWTPELLITCSGMVSGGIQERTFVPKGGKVQLRVKAGDKTLRVRNGIREFGQHRFVEGQGDLPPGWFDALSQAPTVTVTYAGESRSVPGPGPELTRHFERYCRDLARRTSRDET
jgi:hypothetical protein